MSHPRTRIRIRTALLVLALGLGGVGIGIYLLTQPASGLPLPGSDEYRETVRTFYRGLASIEVGSLEDAIAEFAQAAALAPAEPAIPANLAVAHIGFGDGEAAAAQLRIAQALAPDNSEIALLQGQVERFRGRFDEAVNHYQRAAELDADNLKARFALAQELERTGQESAALDAQRLFEEILSRQPQNLAVLVAHVRLAASRGDVAAVTDSVVQLEALNGRWPEVAQEQLRRLRAGVDGGDLAQATTMAVLLRNVLVREPAFLEGQATVSVSAEFVAEPLLRFVRLPSPSPTPAAPDDTLTYMVGLLDPSWSTARSIAAVVLTHDAPAPTIFAADDHEVRQFGAAGAVVFPRPGGGGGAESIPTSLLALDWNSDFRMDLALAGIGGLELLEQTEDSGFREVTPVSADGERVGVGNIAGIWAADVDMDGDLDIVLGTSDATPELLRNNGDGTWLPMQPFPQIVGLLGFAWGDLDQDGDPDAVVLDTERRLRVLSNQQAGRFTEWPAPDLSHEVVALTMGDLNADGLLDVVMLDGRGGLFLSTWLGERWASERVATWALFSPGAAPALHRLLLADLDNNGALDLTVSGIAGTRVWLSDEQSLLRMLEPSPLIEVFCIADLNRDGWLDFVGLQGGSPMQALGRGTAGYQWQEIRPRAQLAAGDQRINSFGIGGEIEVRSGLLVQKQVLTGPFVHFGLGEHPRVDVTRIVWPNGVMQAEFDLSAGQVVVADQRLKGSCPWLFAYDGTSMQFVTDFLWRSPLGLRINAQDTAAITQTEDWVLIRGDQLVPRDGEYDVRLTAELWETHFFDHVSLLVVDHPEDTDVFVDERFARDPVPLVVLTTGKSRPVRRAWDDTGADVSGLLRARDGRYLASFERGTYQGITRDHFVEFELDERVADLDAVWLLAHGWVYPTDSSINLAMGQGRHAAPWGIVLEAQDADGRWTTVYADLGFPAGKNKTMVIALNHPNSGHKPRRLRLRTNLEVYWDWIGHAPRIDDVPVQTARLDPKPATLRYRGYSYTDRLGPRGLEIPRYEIANSRSRWRDLVGYHTRFGDIGELLADVDDRYVIVNAGDELSLRFAAAPPPQPGWRRDFVLIGDGWVKDGDYNTTHSKTVGPLPSHDQSHYDSRASVVLEDDPVYRRYPRDWQTYHTRLVTPSSFLRGLSREPR